MSLSRQPLGENGKVGWRFGVWGVDVARSAGGGSASVYKTLNDRLIYRYFALYDAVAACSATARAALAVMWSALLMICVSLGWISCPKTLDQKISKYIS